MKFENQPDAYLVVTPEIGAVTTDERTGLPLTVAVVARRLGVAPSTLRTWHRRYGIGPTEHVSGADRRYTSGDLERLRIMRSLVLEGVAPGDAARAALASTSSEDHPPEPHTAAPAPAPRPAEPGLGRGGPGGQVLASPGADGAVRGLGRAAMALDAASVVALISSAIERQGVLNAWDTVLRPVLVAVGQRWAQTGEGIEVEHLLSDCMATVLRGITVTAPDVGLSHARPDVPTINPGTLAAVAGTGPRAATAGAPGQRPVLLVCGDEEQHALPLYALSAGLAERGVRTSTLGPALPAKAMAAAVRRTAPAVLFVWSHDPATADCAALLALPTTRPRTTIVVGGPGWAIDPLPMRLTRAIDLRHALHLVDRALGG